jgi:hypothetical protein
MKKIAITIVLCLLIISSICAQQMPYEKLEELSTAISKLQFITNGLTYNDDKSEYQISFPDANFQVAYHNLLSTNAVYKKSNGKEILYVTEDIDLSTVISGKIISTASRLAQVHLEFPLNSIATQEFENGELIGTKEVSSLDFFVNEDYWSLYSEMIKLCNYLKKEKDTFNYDVEEIATIWSRTLNKKSIVGFRNFIKNYPNTLYITQAETEIRLIEKADLAENNRLEQIQIEKERISFIKEANRIEAEKKLLARIAEEARLKKLRNVGFGALRIGYVSSTSTESKSLISIPTYISKINNNQLLNGSTSAPFSAPYSQGQFGLKTGFSAGFTGINHLEFINKNMPSRIGFGMPMDFNVAMMRYSWTGLGNDAGAYKFLYSDAQYGLWGVASIGVGLSLSIRPTDHIFIDLIARPDFYLTTGGKYHTEGTKGTTSYVIETSRSDNSLGFGHTLGINFRFKKLILGFEMRQGIIDNKHFIEDFQINETNPKDMWTSNDQYNVITSGLNLNYSNMSLGTVF